MGNDKLSWIQDELDNLKSAGLYNTIRTIREATKKAIDTFGVGPGAVRTIAGTMSLHIALEQRLAEFKRAEACISFQSGFAANLGTIPAIVGRGDVIFSDELNHASIIDGCRLSRAKVVRYKHNDVDDLVSQIEATAEFGRRVIISDGVFSMDGDIAPLDKLVEVAERYDIMTMVDDAHGEGVLGHGGRGIVDHFGLHGRVDVEIGTLSKAFGVMGGLVAGKAVIVEWLRQRGRPFLFSSAMTVPDTAACLEAVNILQESTELIDRLWANAAIFRAGMQDMGFDTGFSQTPIVPVMLGEAPLAQQFSRHLFEQGVFAMAIGFPTVPRGKARIRVMNSAAHSEEDIKLALKTFYEVGQELGVI
jgi:glycine C-acetyltransferase